LLCVNRRSSFDYAQDGVCGYSSVFFALFVVNPNPRLSAFICGFNFVFVRVNSWQSLGVRG